MSGSSSCSSSSWPMKSSLDFLDSFLPPFFLMWCCFLVTCSGLMIVPCFLYPLFFSSSQCFFSVFFFKSSFVSVPSSLYFLHHHSGLIYFSFSLFSFIFVFSSFNLSVLSCCIMCIISHTSERTVAERQRRGTIHVQRPHHDAGSHSLTFNPREWDKLNLRECRPLSRSRRQAGAMPLPTSIDEQQDGWGWNGCDNR